jgi:CheY-like chemotaxis protein
MKKILLVEDTAALAEEIADLLRLEGYGVTVTANGLEALEQLPVVQPDLVLTDLLMPKMNGIELIRTIRTLGIHKTLPIVILSARSADADQAEGKAAGANAFVRKPCKSQELLGAIFALIGDGGH